MSDLKTLFKNSSADGEDPDSRLDRGRDSGAYADRAPYADRAWGLSFPPDQSNQWCPEK